MVEISLVHVEYKRFGGCMIDKNRTIMSFLRFLRALALTGDMPRLEIYLSNGERLDLMVSVPEKKERALKLVGRDDGS